MTLQELLAGAAAELPDVAVEVAPGGEMSWSRAGRPFAMLSVDGRMAEFALDPAVAAAAARTPDVEPSRRGAGWVSFAPAHLDDHSADRAVAWFESAHRRVARG